jgi:hypothetical protein
VPGRPLAARLHSPARSLIRAGRSRWGPMVKPQITKVARSLRSAYPRRFSKNSRSLPLSAAPPTFSASPARLKSVR